ncbi:DedA family protein [Anaeromicropila populeti]|uniref:Membrane protein DedA, SNARE-associated domain n=1 Tax=Anaeromicropila populeti TaxID=37658 RepID=A0A1I6IQM3_9FIRM|nr:DedA family protein [Anaeromicropila populeti]SFR68929.1 membrane protein DedA, SNARE-associated domain [Anaeromicropila populeti]
METLLHLIHQYGLPGMFFLIMIEYACFPISSEIVLPFSGAMASTQQIDYLLILAVSVIAGLLGTSFCYFVGRLGGFPILERLCKKHPKMQKSMDSCYQYFDKHGRSAVCIGRVIPICRTYIAFVAGALKLKYSVFLLASFAGISLWNSILIGLGYLFRENWGLVQRYYNDYKAFFFCTLAILALVLIIRFLRHRSQNRN